MKLLLKDNRRYFLRFDKGEELLTEIKSFCLKENITTGYFSAIGSATQALLGFYNSVSKAYEQQEFSGDMEVISFVGNIAKTQTGLALHAHGSFSGQDFKTFSGHVFSLTVSATCELFFIKLEGEITRSLNSKFNLNLLN